MSEYGTTEIRTTYAEIGIEGDSVCIHTVWISDIQAFGATPQLSEIQTDHPHHNRLVIL